jgi:preprotein translocase subunit SecB
MPWIHFQSNPEFFMRDSLTTFQRNLSTTQADNIETGFTVDYDGQVSVNDNFFQNTNVATETIFTTGFYVGDNPQGDNFVFDSSVNDSCAIFDVSIWESSVGMLHQEKVGVPDNDSITFQQVFINDYAYDDGSAEKAYSLTAAGGKIAMRYSIAQPDTLLGLAIHFTPFYTNSDAETFLLRAWADSAGIPGVELAPNYQFHTPQYFTDGYDLFAFYEYDQPTTSARDLQLWIQWQWSEDQCTIGFIFIFISIKYRLNIDINSKAVKDGIIEVNTVLKFSDQPEILKKSHFEIIYTSIVKVDKKVSDKKEMEKIILCDVPNKIYPALERIFLNLLTDSGYPGIKFEKKIDFTELYKQRAN